MKVAGLRRYPVKSFQGELLDAVPIGPKGARGDRRWAVIDPGTGKALSAKREPRLLDAVARLTSDDEVVVTLPDGTEATVGDPALDAAIAAWLGRPGACLRQAAEEQPATYEMNISAEDPDSPLVDIPCPPGTYLDFAAVHILTTASLRAIAAEYGDGVWDVARFRPTVLVDTDDEGFVEDDWIGRTVRIGGCVVQPFMPTVRCAMVTRAQRGDLPRDLEIVKTINREHDANLGVYGIVVEAGQVAVGDDIAVI